MTRRRGRGQALVEFTVVIPVFLAMLFGVFDFGRVVWATNSLTNAAAEATRFAIVHGGSPNTACPVGPAAPFAKAVPASASCPYPSPSKQAIRDVATQFAIAGGNPITVTVCYGVGCTGDTDGVDAVGAGATNVRGTPVTVVVSSTVSLFTPSLLGMSSFTLSGTSTMLVNH